MNSQPHIRQADKLLAQMSRTDLTASLNGWLPTCRWFADKERGVPTLFLEDAGAVEFGSGFLILTIVRASFAIGPDAIYFVPLYLTERDSALDHSALFEIDFGGRRWRVQDAVTEGFGPWLIRLIDSDGSLSTAKGSISGIGHVAIQPDALAEPCQASTADQSNSSIHFKSMITKVYRKLHEGINPDVEIGKHFLVATTFDAAPRLIGSLHYESADQRYTLAMVQDKIEAPRDAWKLVLESLASSSRLAEDVGPTLGELTANMHAALSAPSANLAFAAEPAKREQAISWERETAERIDNVHQSLATRHSTLSDSAQDLARQFVEKADVLRDRLSGYNDLTGFPLIRVHGDYHLGQILLDANDRWFVVDFEGEPRRPIEERIRKTSPLKDVAGMLRSFAYARAAALQEYAQTNRKRLDDWERTTSADFMAAYLKTIRSVRPELLPADNEAVYRALLAWEIDKALYEVEYELASRPGWLWLPLSSIVAQL